MNENIDLNMCFDGYEEQDKPCVCPECDLWMDASNIVGFGTYPETGFRGNMKKYSNRFAMGFECPKCFTKSICHSTECWIQLVKDYKEIKKENIV